MRLCPLPKEEPTMKKTAKKKAAKKKTSARSPRWCSLEEVGFGVVWVGSLAALLKANPEMRYELGGMKVGSVRTVGGGAAPLTRVRCIAKPSTAGRRKKR
jgi:hypothetical protein